MTKYLLSTGDSTYRKEEYIIDLFRLHFNINPGDVPMKDNMGFDCSFSGVLKSELEKEIQARVSLFISQIEDYFDNVSVTIALTVCCTLVVTVIIENIGSAITSSLY